MKKPWTIGIHLSHKLIKHGYYYSNKTKRNKPVWIISGTFCIWVGSWRCDCLAIWVCYQLIAKPDNKKVAPPGPGPFANLWEHEGKSFLYIFDSELICTTTRQILRQECRHPDNCIVANGAEGLCVDTMQHTAYFVIYLYGFAVIRLMVIMIIVLHGQMYPSDRVGSLPR